MLDSPTWLFLPLTQQRDQGQAGDVFFLFIKQTNNNNRARRRTTTKNNDKRASKKNDERLQFNSSTIGLAGNSPSNVGDTTITVPATKISDDDIPPADFLIVRKQIIVGSDLPPQSFF